MLGIPEPQEAKKVANFGLEEVDTLPEGAQFVDPQGKTRQTPTYEGLDFTTQTLYDMAANDKEREKALSRSYPGKVKRQERTNALYVDDDGTMRRSKGALQTPTAAAAFAASQAAPVVGSIYGEIYGGLAGAGAGTAVEPGGGTAAGAFGGAVAGGAIGGAVGQAFNDAVLTLAGVYDRSVGEEAGELGIAAGAGGVGTAAGRAI